MSATGTHLHTWLQEATWGTTPPRPLRPHRKSHKLFAASRQHVDSDQKRTAGPGGRPPVLLACASCLCFSRGALSSHPTPSKRVILNQKGAPCPSFDKEAIRDLYFPGIFQLQVTENPPQSGLRQKGKLHMLAVTNDTFRPGWICLTFLCVALFAGL